MIKFYFTIISIVALLFPQIASASILNLLVKVKSLGPIDQPELNSTGFAFGYNDKQYVLTTYHGIYTSTTTSEFVIHYSKNESTPCTLISAEYKYDLALLRCDNPPYLFPTIKYLNLDQVIANIDISKYTYYYSHHAAILAGFFADSYEVSVEDQRRATTLQPNPPWSPGLSYQYFVGTDRAAPGWSGGLFVVSSDDRVKMYGMISKISSRDVFDYYQIRDIDGQNIVSIIPESYINYFLNSAFEYGTGIDAGDVLPAPSQDGNPLQTIQVDDFSFNEINIKIDGLNYKVFRVEPIGQPNYAIQYTPYAGHNDFRRHFARDSRCTLLVLAKSKSESDGYKTTGYHFSAIKNLNEFIYHITTPVHDYIDYYGVNFLARAHCPNDLKTLNEKISEALQLVAKVSETHNEFRDQARGYLTELHKIYLPDNLKNDSELFEKLLSSFIESTIFNHTIGTSQPFYKYIAHKTSPPEVPLTCGKYDAPILKNGCDKLWRAYDKLLEAKTLTGYAWFDF